MQAIPSGSFQFQGLDPAPAQAVSVDAFRIGTTEVTVGQWRSVGMAVPWGARWCDDDTCPVTGVTWVQACRFANAASISEGLQPVYDFGPNTVTRDPSANGYRLPTEGEWEYAARGAAPDQWTPTRDRGQFWSTAEGVEKPQVPCGRTANGYSLCDMVGNADEWVWNDYHSYRIEIADTLEVARYGVLRGGSILTDAPDATSRTFEGRDSSFTLTAGFRLAQNAP